MDVAAGFAGEIGEGRGGGRRVFFEVISGLPALSLVVVIEGLGVDEHRDNDLAHPAV